MKKSIKTVILICAVVFFTLGCTLVDNLTAAIFSRVSDEIDLDQVATLTGDAVQVVQQDYLLMDDFSDPQSGWEIYDGEYGTAGYADGGYQVESMIESEYMWGVAGQNFSDIQIDVDAAVRQTVEDGYDAYGVDCRLQENGDGYGFRITSDGWVTISKYVDMESSALVEWFESDAVIMGGGSNHLTAICNGNNLQFLVNGTMVADVTDDTFTSGDIALSVVGFNPGTVSVLFDNVIVQNP